MMSEIIPLVYGSQTPTGYGIGWVADEGGKLVGITPCCNERMVFEWDEIHDYKCAKCQDPVTHWGKISYTDIETSAPLKEQVDWVASVTGLKKSHIKIKRVK